MKSHFASVFEQARPSTRSGVGCVWCDCALQNLFCAFHMRFVCGSDEVSQAELPQVAPKLAEHINIHMLKYEARLAKLTACGHTSSRGRGAAGAGSSGTSLEQACPAWWQRRETVWRERTVQAELRRLCTHARIWRDFLPRSRISLKRPATSANSSIPLVGTFAAFDYFEPDYACMSDERVPAHVGDGPKWVCGAAALPRPCDLLALGSNFDDAFERAMHRRAGCRAYIVDPTLDHSGKLSGVYRGSAGATRADAVARFAASLASYGASLNSSIGVGDATRGTGTVVEDGGKGVVHFPVVSVTSLLRDRYGAAPWHLSSVKIDIEGNEAPVLREMYALCAAGHLTIAQLNVEVHAAPAWFRHSFRTYHELYAAFSEALSCGLMLHHKERNLWGCAESQCMEYAWVSLDHARREALHATTEALDSRAPQVPLAPATQAPSHAARALTTYGSGNPGGGSSSGHAVGGGSSGRSGLHSEAIGGTASVNTTAPPTLLDILDSSDKPAVVLDAIHGLGNRLRAYSSAKAIVDANGYRLILLWRPDVHCNARFEELFEHDPSVPVVERADERIFSRADVWAIRIGNSGLPPILLGRDGRELPPAGQGSVPGTVEQLAGQRERNGQGLKGKGGGQGISGQRPSGTKHVYVRTAVILTPRDLGLPLKSFAAPPSDGKETGSSSSCGPQCRVGVMTRATARKLVPVPAVRDALRALTLQAGLAAARPLPAGGVPRQLGIHVRMAANMSEDVPSIASEASIRPWNGVQAMGDMPTHRERCTWRSFIAPALTLLLPPAAASAGSSPQPLSAGRLPIVYVAADVRGVAQQLCEALTSAVSAHLATPAAEHERSHTAARTITGAPALRCITAPERMINGCFGSDRRGAACQRLALAEALMLSRSSEMLYSDMSSYSWLTMALARGIRTKRSGCAPLQSATDAGRSTPQL